MFKLRRRAVAATAVSDLPFCAMCGTSIRVDTATGRCALGHRVLAITVPVAIEAPALADETAVAAPATVYDDTTVFDNYDTPVSAYVDESSAGVAGEGLYEAYSSADAGDRVVTWEDVIAPPATEGGGVYDDYLTWDEPAAGFSSLDVDTAELSAEAEAEDEPLADSPIFTPLPADLLDELDDEAHARRRTIGTIGATVGFSALAMASIAVLPF